MVASALPILGDPHTLADPTPHPLRLTDARAARWQAAGRTAGRSRAQGEQGRARHAQGAAHRQARRRLN
eukprot:463988-Prymnesium_polylepis.1